MALQSFCCVRRAVTKLYSPSGNCADVCSLSADPVDEVPPLLSPPPPPSVELFLLPTVKPTPKPTARPMTASTISATSRSLQKPPRSLFCSPLLNLANFSPSTGAVRSSSSPIEDVGTYPYAGGPDLSVSMLLKAGCTCELPAMTPLSPLVTLFLSADRNGIFAGGLLARSPSVIVDRRSEAGLEMRFEAGSRRLDEGSLAAPSGDPRSAMSMSCLRSVRARLMLDTRSVVVDDQVDEIIPDL